MTLERKCKGSVVLDMVKVVRAFKDLPWDKHLKPEDRQIVNSMVMPTEWYPLESYMRIGMAVFKLVARENEEAVRQFARAAMKELFEGAYRPFLDKHDPFLAVNKFLELRKSLFNFHRSAMEKTGDQSLQVRLFNLGEIEEGLEVFQLLLGVHLQELIRYNGGEEVEIKTRQEIQEGEKTLVFDLAWS